MPLVEQELPTLPEHLSSPLVFSEVRVTRSLVLCVCFVSLFYFLARLAKGKVGFCHPSLGFRSSNAIRYLNDSDEINGRNICRCLNEIVVRA